MIKEAKRKAIPLIISLAGTSGSGKTYSALLMAAGLAGKDGKVGFLDTETGRGSMYADDPDIIEALPEGKYYIDELNAPFHPHRYIDKINDFIKFGVNVLVVDSVTHEYEGLGGISDIAENNKLGGLPNWAMAKLPHKRFMNMLTQCPMHVIFCLRARDKSKPKKYICKKTGKEKTGFIELGIQPIQEKGFMFDMTLAMMMTTRNPGVPDIMIDYYAPEDGLISTPEKKCPKALLPFFADKKPITKEIGEKLKHWADGGVAVDIILRNLQRECRDRALQGEDSLDHWRKNLADNNKKLVKEFFNEEFRSEIRALAQEADKIEAETEKENSAEVINDG